MIRRLLVYGLCAIRSVGSTVDLASMRRQKSQDHLSPLQCLCRREPPDVDLSPDDQFSEYPQHFAHLGGKQRTVQSMRTSRLVAAPDSVSDADPRYSKPD